MPLAYVWVGGGRGAPQRIKLSAGRAPMAVSSQLREGGARRQGRATDREDSNGEVITPGRQGERKEKQAADHEGTDKGGPERDQVQATSQPAVVVVGVRVCDDGQIRASENDTAHEGNPVEAQPWVMRVRHKELWCLAEVSGGEEGSDDDAAGDSQDAQSCRAPIGAVAGTTVLCDVRA